MRHLNLEEFVKVVYLWKVEVPEQAGTLQQLKKHPDHHQQDLPWLTISKRNPTQKIVSFTKRHLWSKLRGWGTALRQGRKVSRKLGQGMEVSRKLRQGVKVSRKLGQGMEVSLKLRQGMKVSLKLGQGRKIYRKLGQGIFGFYFKCTYQASGGFSQYL